MKQEITEFIRRALAEDLSSAGDITSLSCFDNNMKSKAAMIAKEPLVAAGMEVAEAIFKQLNPELSVSILTKDGSRVAKGEKMLLVEGDSRGILSGERTVLNIVQRMSGIATKTSKMVEILAGTGTRILDTRKTTPTLRYFEKWAVRIGGGVNHRFGLYDMVMIKDNHSDFCGGAGKALRKVKSHLEANDLRLKIVVEARDLPEVDAILMEGGADRILLDNFSPAELGKAIAYINKQVETEASGGITEDNLREYALSGVDFISSGALTHSVKSPDISLKAIN